MARRDPATPLDLVEEPLDQVAGTTEAGTEADRAAAVNAPIANSVDMAMARKFNDALNLDFRDFRPDSGKRVVSSYWSKGKELCDFQSRCLQFLFERARGRKESGIWKLRSIEAVPGPERPDRLPVRPGGVLIV